MRLFGILRHSKITMYMEELREPHTSPGKRYSQKRPEWTLSFHLRLILKLRTHPTGEALHRYRAGLQGLGEVAIFFKCPIFK